MMNEPNFGYKGFYLDQDDYNHEIKFICLVFRTDRSAGLWAGTSSYKLDATIRNNVLNPIFQEQSCFVVIKHHIPGHEFVKGTKGSPHFHVHQTALRG